MDKPTIVCLCGSTRFSEAFQQANLMETLDGNIVLTIGCDMRSDADIFQGMDDEEVAHIKAKLDELHLRKIDLADEVLILNVGGYIGESTARELAYAKAHGKRIRFLEESRDWQVCWYQSLLLLTNAPVEVEVLQDNLTEEEAKAELLHWQVSLRGAVGAVVIARQRPPKIPNENQEVDDASL